MEKLDREQEIDETLQVEFDRIQHQIDRMAKEVERVKVMEFTKANQT